MAKHFPSGGTPHARRDAKVKRIHIVNGGDRTLCNRPKTDGDVAVTLYGHIGDRMPSNACKACRRIWFK